MKAYVAVCALLVLAVASASRQELKIDSNLAEVSEQRISTALENLRSSIADAEDMANPQRGRTKPKFKRCKAPNTADKCAHKSYYTCEGGKFERYKCSSPNKYVQCCVGGTPKRKPRRNRAKNQGKKKPQKGRKAQKNSKPQRKNKPLKKRSTNRGSTKFETSNKLPGGKRRPQSGKKTRKRPQSGKNKRPRKNSGKKPTRKRRTTGKKTTPRGKKTAKGKKSTTGKKPAKGKKTAKGKKSTTGKKPAKGKEKGKHGGKGDHGKKKEQKQDKGGKLPCFVPLQPKKAEKAGGASHAKHEKHGLVETLLHKIHYAHLCAELLHHYEHVLKHAWEHSKARAALTRYKKAWSDNVNKIHKAFRGYADAWRTSEFKLALERTLQRARDAKKTLQQKIAAGRVTAGNKMRDLNKAIREATKSLTANRPKFAKAQEYLAKYVAKLGELYKVFKNVLGPVFKSAVNAGRGAVALLARSGPLLQQLAKGAAVVVRSAAGVGRLGLHALKLVVSPTAIKWMMYIGVALEGIHGYQISKAETQGGRIVNGIMHGAVGYLVMCGKAAGPKACHPWVALADILLPDSLKISTTLKGSADIIVAYAEWIYTGKPEMLKRVTEANLKGENGYILNLAAALGAAAAGEWRYVEDLNKRTLQGKNGAILNMAAAYGTLFATGDFKELRKYNERAKAGNFKGVEGWVAQQLAVSGEYWAKHGLKQGILNVWDAVSPPPSKDATERVPMDEVKKKGKGVYMKLVSCTGLKVKSGGKRPSKPYWSCTANYKTADTKPGYGRPFKWDPSTKGFGLFFQRVKKRGWGAKGYMHQKTITCKLKSSVRYWVDSSHSPVLRVYNKAGNQKHADYDVKCSANSRSKCGKCKVLYYYHK